MKFQEMKINLVSLLNLQPQLMLHTTLQLLLHTKTSSLNIMKNQLLISIPTLKTLKPTFILLNQLQILTITISMNQLKNISLMNQLQFHGTTTMLSHQPHFIGMNNQLNHTTKLLNHLHIFHTTIMNHQLNNTTHMNQLLLFGLISTSNHPLNCIIMMSLLAATTLRKNHPQLCLTIIINLLLTHLLNTNHPQFNGLITTKNQLLIFTPMNQFMKLTHMFLNHLHMPHMFTTNHPLKAMLSMSHNQFHGLLITMSQALISIPMMNQLNHTKSVMSHLPTTPTITSKNQLRAMLSMNQLQFNGLTSMKSQLLISTTLKTQQKRPTPLSTSHLHMLATTTMKRTLKTSLLMNQLQFNGLLTMNNQLLNSTPSINQLKISSQ